MWDSEPRTSNLNLVPGQIAANLVVLPTRDKHPEPRFQLYNKAGDTHVAADLAGYFVAPPAPCTADCLYAWGASQGEAGTGTTQQHVGAPVPVRGLSGVVASSGRYAVRADGTVWGWGANWWYVLGDPGQSDTNVPVRLTRLSGITAIAANDSTAYALRADGTVVSWGGNDRASSATAAPSTPPGSRYRCPA